MEKKPSSDLARFVSSLSGGDGLRVEENLGEGFVRLRVSEAERRQAKHDIRCVEDVVIELLRNARDAGARHIWVATSREGDCRTTVVVDDGVGIPADMREHVFEARVTSKLETMRTDRWGVHGRGMALFSIRERCDSAEVLDSGVARGTAIRVVSRPSVLTERADQSTWPSTSRSSGKLEIVSGPHNIVRTCCEFALEESGCKVYVGSPSEVVSTIRARIIPDASKAERVVDRIALAPDAPALGRVAGTLGLPMSERTAYRIVSEEIRPLRNVAVCLERKGRGARATSLERPVHPSLSKRDREEFAQELSRDFASLAERYYLELVGSPRIRVGDGRITVTFDIAEKD